MSDKPSLQRLEDDFRGNLSYIIENRKRSTLWVFLLAASLVTAFFALKSLRENWDALKRSPTVLSPVVPPASSQVNDSVIPPLETEKLHTSREPGDTSWKPLSRRAKRTKNGDSSRGLTEIKTCNASEVSGGIVNQNCS